MAKKKKKPTRWQIPAPTPFDAMRNPDLTDHIGELMLREIKLSIIQSCLTRIPAS